MPLITDTTKTSNNSSLLELERAKLRLQEAKSNNDISTFNKIVNPLTEAIEELTDVIEQVKKGEQDYYDKDLTKELSQSIDKIAAVLSDVKQPELDLTPITAPIVSIATEIKSQNKNLLELVTNLFEQSNKDGYELLLKEAMVMIQKSNDFINNGMKQMDYSQELNNINATLESDKRANEWIFKVERDSTSLQRIIRVIATAKT